MPSARARPARCTPVAELPSARGCIEEMSPTPRMGYIFPPSIATLIDRLPWPRRGLRIRGWMLLPDGPFERIAASVKGIEFYTGTLLDRPDVGATYPFVPDACASGFCFEIPGSLARKGRLDIVGIRQGRPVACLTTSFCSDLAQRVPSPPPDLMFRVANTRIDAQFKAGGYKAYGELRGALERQRSVPQIRRLLDWGCGCGRITAHWLRCRRGPEVFGCDIDSEAIAWCQANLPNGRFEVVPFEPPTRYPDGHFDAIIGCSVFTHLRAELQRAWLAEMRRLLAPEGVFVTSVHGPSAAWLAFGERTNEALAQGIHDATPDLCLNGAVPDGEYRLTYQTEEYSRRVFGEYFHVAEYTERGLGHRQDLLVLRPLDSRHGTEGAP